MQDEFAFTEMQSLNIIFALFFQILPDLNKKISCVINSINFL